MLNNVDHLDKVKNLRVTEKDVQGLKAAYDVRHIYPTCFRCAYAQSCHSLTVSTYSAEGRICSDGKLMVRGCATVRWLSGGPGHAEASQSGCQSSGDQIGVFCGSPIIQLISRELDMLCLLRLN